MERVFSGEYPPFLELPSRPDDDRIPPGMKTSRYSRRQFFARSAAVGSLLIASDALPVESLPVKRTAVDQVTLGRTGIRLSRLGFGTGSDSGHIQRNLGREAFNSLIHYAFDRGITYFDCAQAYSTFEWMAGALKGLPREKLFIQSKVDHRPDDILGVIDHHRKVFDTDYVDSLLIHCMVSKNWPETWKGVRDGFDQAQERKWIRAKGVSCHSLPALSDATESDWPQVHLVRVNPQGAFMDGPDEHVNMANHPTGPVLQQLAVMRAKGRGVIGMKMIGNGTFVDAEEREKSLRFAMSRPELDAVVVGFKSRAEIDEAIERINSALA